MGIKSQARMTLEQIGSFLVFLSVLYLPISPKQKGRKTGDGACECANVALL